ncbi:unnamed protein product [Arctogadus glacialis]
MYERGLGQAGCLAGWPQRDHPESEESSRGPGQGQRANEQYLNILPFAKPNLNFHFNKNLRSNRQPHPDRTTTLHSLPEMLLVPSV